MLRHAIRKPAPVQSENRTLQEEVEAVERYLNSLRRRYPRLLPREAFIRLYDIEPGIQKVPPWRYHREILKHEPGRDSFRKRNTTYNRRINWLIGRLDKIAVLGGPIKCQECGAEGVDQRTIWCVSNCLTTTDALGRKMTDALGRKARIREELTRGLLLPGGKWRMIPKRGSGSRLGWLPECAARLSEYLGSATGHRADSLAVYSLVAGLLTTASGERITEQMVKDRVIRHHDPRQKYKS